MPSEEEIKEDISKQLSQANIAFREYIKNCQGAQERLLEVENQIDSELQELEQKIIDEIK